MSPKFSLRRGNQSKETLVMKRYVRRQKMKTPEDMKWVVSWKWDGNFGTDGAAFCMIKQLNVGTGLTQLNILPRAYFRFEKEK